MLDLDNTLLDRDSAFRASVTAFLETYGLPGADAGWVMAVDAHGYTPRADVARAIAERYRCVPREPITTLLDRGGADHVVLAPGTRQALDAASAAGWAPVVVTNGTAAQQEAKIRLSGLDRHVRAWVVSETAGHRKPDPAIFEAAAVAGDSSLKGAWMVGDSPEADVGGALAVGAGGVWISRGCSWPALPYRPAFTAGTVADAVARIIAS